MQNAGFVAKANEVSAWLPGKRVKFDFGSEGVAVLDGIANRATEEDGPADTTITMSWDDLMAIREGKLDGMTAFMLGKLKVTGDMSNAMQLQGVLAKMSS